MTESIPINKILTHEFPDLDAMLSVLLLRQFGEEKFPGVSKAEVTFSSAGQLPDDLTPKQLEKKGILAVDIGGGRFDSHPSATTGRAKKDRSATDLVAEYLEVIDHPEWSLLVEYARLQDTTGHSMYSTNQMHHLVSLHTILLGLGLLYPDDSATKLAKGIRVIENIPYYVRHKQDNFSSVFLREGIQAYLEKQNIDLEDPPAWIGLFKQWLDRLNQKPKAAFGKNPMDRIVSLKAICQGAYFRYGEDMEKVQPILELCLEAMFEREKTWQDALDQYDQNTVVKEIHALRLVTISSANGMVIKAARFRHKPDILFYQNPEDGAVTIFVQRRGRLEQFPFETLAARIRIAEAVESGEAPDYENLEAHGTHHGWFLHQSNIMLIRGSKKQTDFIPTKISLENINLLIYSIFDHGLEMQLPKAYVEAIWKYRNPLFR